jgi:hypothetical protein
LGSAPANHEGAGGEVVQAARNISGKNSARMHTSFQNGAGVPSARTIAMPVRRLPIVWPPRQSVTPFSSR